MVCGHLRTCLRLDRDLKVVGHKVHLDAAGQAPVRQARESLAVGVVRTQLVEHPILEGFAVQLRARPQGATSCEMVHHSDVGKVEFRCGDDAALGALGVCR